MVPIIRQLKSASAASRALFGKQVLLIGVPGILLLLLVAYLFYVLFKNSLANLRGPEAIEEFKFFLIALQKKLAQGEAVNLASERSVLEKVLNKVKTANTAAQIRSDRSLRFQFVRTYNTITEAHPPAGSPNGVDFLRLSSLMEEFYDHYFTASGAGHHHSLHWVKGFSHLPTAAIRPIRSRHRLPFPRPSWHSRS
ncbi:hypothetical protein EPD60_14190 [Flaviaesturariibacter flavus]|uniref:Uncharacterized protein n=1 Tax=Flaviaesturariibacter flavus TaxID=2502780 RepID=A0A4R1B8H1_9BACT|nr:hypothetical protein [Flaviaesturariibacter flavus]TCJ12423.1 hypothetical protein EPD60_14190 [Flaviaesturariibacter flavus]